MPPSWVVWLQLSNLHLKKATAQLTNWTGIHYAGVSASGMPSCRPYHASLHLIQPVSWHIGKGTRRDTDAVPPKTLVGLHEQSMPIGNNKWPCVLMSASDFQINSLVACIICIVDQMGAGQHLLKMHPLIGGACHHRGSQHAHASHDCQPFCCACAFWWAMLRNC